MSKRTIPFLLLGAGVLAGIVAFWPKQTVAPGNNTGVTTTGGENNWSNIGTSLTNLINTIVGQVQTVVSSTKSQGTITGIQRWIVNGQNLIGLVTAATVQNLKAGNKITVTPAAGSNQAMAGEYTVAKVDGSVIVISKAYTFTTSAFNGTYKEV